jgi:hypothetical protein
LIGPEMGRVRRMTKRRSVGDGVDAGMTPPPLPGLRMPMVVAGVSADPAGRGIGIGQAGQLMRQMGPRRDDDITGQMGGAAAFIRLDQRQSGQNGQTQPPPRSARGAT